MGFQAHPEMNGGLMMFDFATYTMVHEEYVKEMFSRPTSQHYRAAKAAKKKDKCMVQIKGKCIIR